MFLSRFSYSKYFFFFLQAKRPGSEERFVDDDDDHFLNLDSEDGHDDDEPLPPRALPITNGRYII